MTSIGIFESEEIERRYLERLLSNHKLSFYHEPLSTENINKVKDCEVIIVFIYSKIDKKLLDKLPKVKLIVTMSTGYEHIDIKECKRRKIAVCNVPAYGEMTVAEHTFALLLAISRKIVESVERTRKGDFSIEGLTGFDLNNKTIGIIGTGKIGSHVAKIANSFEMKIIAHSEHKNEALEELPNFKYVEIDEILKNSDIITLHAPLTNDTIHMINKKNIKKIKKGAILINTARGGLVETEALLFALKNGIIKYAGLDVLEEECFVKEEKELLSPSFKKTCDLRTVLANHMLIKQENVIITPHNAFNSEEALLKIVSTTVETINAFINGKNINVVN